MLLLCKSLKSFQKNITIQLDVYENAELETHNSENHLYEKNHHTQNLPFYHIYTNKNVI